VLDLMLFALPIGVLAEETSRVRVGQHVWIICSGEC
jgi:hypothetical protein